LRCAWVISTLAVLAVAAGMMDGADAQGAPAGSSATPTFADDLAFLKAHTDVIVLADEKGNAQVALAPDWQGRVMTSTAQGLGGASFGWINRRLIADGRPLPHFNPRGGEDRMWLGPEGGQFSIYFAHEAPFDLDHWYVPKALDTTPFEVIHQGPDRVAFASHFELTNYSGQHFHIDIEREVKLLSAAAIWSSLSLPEPHGVSTVGFESVNTLRNSGNEPWRKETGLLSLWILGMFNPSPDSNIVIPVRSGSDLGKVVTSDYFGAIPSDRLCVGPDAIYLKADGALRSKVGVNPKRSRGTLGAYDARHRVLTLVQFDQPQGLSDYVNSLWKLQEDPFAGDALNAYNDGPPAPGKPPMGPFFELESSSPAAALAPGKSLTHTHRTIHLTGPESALDPIARATLGVSLATISSVFGQSAADKSALRTASSCGRSP
jgi:uncharacterized protein DUF6786